jgi:hypothetical protein
MLLRALVPALACAAMLAACEPSQVGPGATTSVKAKDAEDVLGQQARARGPVALPPSISGAKTYRCADNSVLAVEFYSDRATATVRAGEKGESVRVKAPAPDGTMVADGGWSLKGGVKDAKVTVTTPKTKKPLSCHV